MKSIRKKHVLNFLTDEGLLPNYAFPEAGVTLRSILWRKYRTEQQNGKKYETFTLSYERPGSLAIRELVPSGVFYAEGRKVKIDQIDLKLSEPADWRICRSCSYTTLNTTEIAQLKTCPRCGDSMWQDSGRIRRMLRLKQVMASTSDKNSRFGDDSDERSPTELQPLMIIGAVGDSGTKADRSPPITLAPKAPFAPSSDRSPPPNRGNHRATVTLSL
jgi:DEAD/DEAH box helicase domain-containing protein